MSDEGEVSRLPVTPGARDLDLYGTDELVAELLADAQTWFVVGLSRNRARAAYGVARFLHDKGRTIVPIHPRAEDVRGARAFATVEQAAALLGPPDVVDIFVRSALAGPIVDSAVAVGAGAAWLQFDVIDEAAARRARDAGLQVVMDRCPARGLAQAGASGVGALRPGRAGSRCHLARDVLSRRRLPPARHDRSCVP